MLKPLDTDILVEELQLGEKLNQSVHSSRRSDFALMLAMLTEDVRAHSQFHLPKTDEPVNTLDEEQLRKQFDLPEKQRLALNNIDEISEFSQAELIATQQLASIHLAQAIKPKPLAFRDDSKHIALAVMENTSLYCQQQHQQPNELADAHLAFNVNEWLKTVQTTIVKSPLVDVAA
ncbi:hypothetical protein tinsulaeT_34750 [Thalassotalea insulae]|uniref:QueD like 2 n=1 Tax=Thalassotalea insulae TaxID=2056778 RepID=A0ABQ6GZF5_9GAMM|nr:VC2046/SO_2500 family protein [Thalassotalea insulae]GLX80135.1 hypothetical protein tinsulaeT_34750 [Thalassotalea insulae]